MNRVDEAVEEELVNDGEPGEVESEPEVVNSEGPDKVSERQEDAFQDWKQWISMKVDERRSRKVERPGTLTLTGLVEFIVSGHGARSLPDRVFIEWKADQVFCWSADNKPTIFGSPDCIITVSEDVFEELKYGNINAQIAMCAGKIKVSGNSESYAELAMYTFNIFGQY
jgi:hypothetical protein